MLLVLVPEQACPLQGSAGHPSSERLQRGGACGLAVPAHTAELRMLQPAHARLCLLACEHCQLPSQRQNWLLRTPSGLCQNVPASHISIPGIKSS